MVVVQYKSARQITTDILIELAARLGISDANLGSAIRTISYAFSVEIAALYLQLYFAQKGYYIREATGDFLDKRASDFGLTRETARRSVGFCTFTGTSGSVISAGDRVKKPATAVTDAVVFEVTTGGTVAGSGVIELPVRALVAGETGNVAATSITEQVTAIAGITSVSNVAQTRLGRAEEDDATLRERILRHIDGLSRGTVPSIYAGAVDFRLQILNVHGFLLAADTEIAVYEDLNLIPIATSGTLRIGESATRTYSGIDTTTTPHKLTGVSTGSDHPDGTEAKEFVPSGTSEYIQSAKLVETLGRVDVYLDDGGSVAMASELVALVQGRLRGDGTTRNPGYKAAGTLLYCYAATLTTITVSATITVAVGYFASAVFAEAQDRVIREINSLGVGKTVYAYKIAAIVQETSGVETLHTLTINSVSFTGTNSADVVVSPTAVARANSGTVGIS